jgi:hypothetical protein
MKKASFSLQISCKPLKNSGEACISLGNLNNNKKKELVNENSAPEIKAHSNN